MAPLPCRDDARISDGVDVRFELRLNGERLSRPVLSAMYWTPAPMLAHMTVNGAATRTGRPVRLRDGERA